MHTVVADLTQEEGRKLVVDTAKAVSGSCGLYGLVNNAGLCLPGNVEWLPMSAYEASMALNFHSPVALTYELLPALKTARGRVVNVTSVDGFLALPTNAAYNASKHALEAYSDTLRCEMRPWGVRVVVIEPATMRTPLAMGFADGWLRSYREASDERRAPYGDAWAERVAAVTKQGLEDLAADPQQTVSALLRVLRLKEPPSRMTTGLAAKLLFKPLSLLPDKTRDAVLYAMSFSVPPPDGLVLQPPKPPAGVVSHLTIRVRSLAASVPWYEKFGLLRLGGAIEGQQFLRAGAHARWQPLVLLLEDSAMGPRGESYDGGMTRLCVYAPSIDREVARLSALGLEPIAPPAGRTERIAAYKDPDGFVVYLIVFNLPLGPLLWVARWWQQARDPQLFHWTINVTDVHAALDAFDALGFRSVYDAQPQQVQHNLLPAFNLSPTTTVIKHIRLAKLPEDAFLATIMEWVTPRTELRGAERLNSMSLSVADVDRALDDAARAGLRTEPPVRRVFPVLGQARVGVAFVDGSRIELCSFS